MFFYLKKLLIITLFLSFSFKVFGNEPVAYLDIDFIFNNTNIGKKVILNLNEENKQNLLELNKKQEILKKEEKDLINKKKLITDNQFKKELSQLNQNIQLFRNKKDELVKKFEKKKNSEIQSFFKKITPILKKYMNENSINMIIDKKNVLMATDTLDITEDIYNLINSELN